MVALTACSSVKPAVQPILDAIHLQYQATVEGEYAVQIYKDGHILYVEKWNCTIPDGQVVPKCVRVAHMSARPLPSMADEPECHDAPSAPPES